MANHKTTIYMSAMLLVVLLAACRSQGDMQNSTNVTNKTVEQKFIFKTYGGFVPEDMASQELMIEKSKLTYTVYSRDGLVTRRVTKLIDDDTFKQVESTFRKNDFVQFKDEYTLPLGVAIADASDAELIYFDGKKEKTVKITPYILEYVPEEVKNVAQVMQTMVEFANDISPQEAQKFAKEWLENSPTTYNFDGSMLDLVDHAQLESYPVQHVLTFKFQSNHGGYGNRTGKIVAQVIKQHTTKITVVDGRIVSAVTDNVYDELAQRIIESEGKTTMTFAPLQCQSEPWNSWYESGEINFIKEPTENELASLYYSSKQGITISDFGKIEKADVVVCMACDICPTTYYYTASVVSIEDVTRMQGLGWTRS